MCSAARQNLFNAGRTLEVAGNVIKWGAVGGAVVGGGALGIGAVTGQLELALPGALVLSRSVQAYEAGSTLSTVGVAIQSLASENPAPISADLLDDYVARSLGLGPVSTDAVGELLDAINGVEASCGN